jgi:hypothetical protein
VKLRLAMIAATMAFAIAAPAFAEPMTVLAKAGGTVASRAIDDAQCAAVGEATRNTAYASGPNGGSGGLIVQLASDGSIVADAKRACMAERGWASVELTKEEAGQLSRLTGDKQDAWLNTFFAGTIGPRVQAAMPVPYNPLPPSFSGPSFIGGLSIDPARVVLSGVPASKKGGVILRGQAAYRQTATVPRDLRLKFGIRPYYAAKDAVFHQVGPMWRGDSAAPAIWCGPVSPSGSSQVVPWCFSNSVGGGRSYDVSVAWGKPWLVSSRPWDTPPQNLDFLRMVTPLLLEIEAPGSRGLVDYTLETAGLTATTVKLKAFAHNGEENVLFWTGELIFDATGEAVLPFWTRRLVLTRLGDTIQARLEDTGKGDGWPW